MKAKILILLVVILFISSCQKSDNDLISDNDCSDVLYFENLGNFNEELESVLSLSKEEKIIWERQKGFNSLGIAAEKFYESINPDDFKSIDEVKSFVEENAKYIQLVEDNGEYSVEPIFYDSPLRFFMNEEHIFQIGQRAYKVFNKGIVATTTKDLDKLMKIDEVSFDAFKNDPDVCYSVKTEKSYKSISASDCSDATVGDENGGSDESCIYEPHSKKYRTIIEIKADHFDDYFEGTIAISWYKVKCQVRNLGIWWGHSTTINSEVRSQLVYQHSVHGSTTVNTSDDYTASSVKYIERYSGFVSDVFTGSDPEPYFNKYYARGSITDGNAVSCVKYYY